MSVFKISKMISIKNGISIFYPQKREFSVTHNDYHAFKNFDILKPLFNLWRSKNCEF